MQFIKVDRDKIMDFDIDINIDGDIEVYFLKDDNKLLGYGLINRDVKENMIYIYIYEEYRGNGFGSKLFGYLYNGLKNSEIKELLFTIDKSNTRFISIIDKYDSLLLGTKENIVKYLVVIK